MTLSIPKKRHTFRSEVYLDYIRSQPCAVCAKLGLRQRFRTTPHHVFGVGHALFGGDDYTAPLCLEVHHKQGVRETNKIMEDAGIPPAVEIAYQQRKFIEERKLEWVNGDFEETLIAAGLGERNNPGKRVSNGTAKSRGKKPSGIRPLTKECKRREDFGKV